MSTHLKAILITSTAVLLMSLESLFIKISSLQALSFSFYIGIFMFLSLNAFLYLKNRTNTFKIYKVDILPILICGFLFGTSNLFFISSIKNTSVANTVMILSTGALFASVFSYFLYKEKLKKNIFISSFFIFIGLFIIFSSQIGTGNFIGNFYALCSVICFSLSFVFLSKFKSANRVAITSFAGLCTATISFLFINDFSIELIDFLIVFIAGVLISSTSRVLLGIGTKSLPASEVSLLMIIETIMAPIWVWIFLNEIPSSTTFLGGAVILTTLIINSLYILKNKNF